MALISKKFGSNSIPANVADVLYDDGRDKECDISKGINPTPSGGTEKFNDTKRDEGEHLDDSASVEATSGGEENDKEYEGD
nr:hypothetical protein [Tanacetum cinerariifolium]